MSMRLNASCPKVADVNAKSASGWTPLHWAAYEGHKPVVELLLARGADIQAQNRLGSTPLSDAARRGHKDVLEFLPRVLTSTPARHWLGPLLRDIRLSLSYCVSTAPQNEL